LEILDVRQSLLDLSMHRAVAKGIVNVRTTRGDGQALPYPDRRFDAAYLDATR
jgi:ubiquinone/menaquinone biosynthesis C-methylase UbiE